MAKENQDAKSLLIMALKALMNSGNPQDQVKAKRLGPVINQLFISKKTTDEVTSILKNRAREKKLSSRGLGMKEWNGAQSQGQDQSPQESAESSQETTSKNAAVNLNELLILTNQELIDRFNTIEGVQEWAKEQGFEVVDMGDPEAYLGDLRDAISAKIEADSDRELEERKSRMNEFLKATESISSGDITLIEKEYQKVSNLRAKLRDEFGLDFEGVRSNDETIARFLQYRKEALELLKGNV